MLSAAPWPPRMVNAVFMQCSDSLYVNSYNTKWNSHFHFIAYWQESQKNNYYEHCDFILTSDSTNWLKTENRSSKKSTFIRWACLKENKFMYYIQWNEIVYFLGPITVKGMEHVPNIFMSFDKYLFLEVINIII